MLQNLGSGNPMLLSRVYDIYMMNRARRLSLERQRNTPNSVTTQFEIYIRSK